MTKDDWRPMSEAPRDRCILVFVDYQDGDQEYIVAEYRSFGTKSGWGTLNGYDVAAEYVTHWQPLPEPPEPA